MILNLSFPYYYISATLTFTLSFSQSLSLSFKRSRFQFFTFTCFFRESLSLKRLLIIENPTTCYWGYYNIKRFSTTLATSFWNNLDTAAGNWSVWWKWLHQCLDIASLNEFFAFRSRKPFVFCSVSAVSLNKAELRYQNMYLFSLMTQPASFQDHLGLFVAFEFNYFVIKRWKYILENVSPGFLKWKVFCYDLGNFFYALRTTF